MTHIIGNVIEGGMPVDLRGRRIKILVALVRIRRVGVMKKDVLSLGGFLSKEKDVIKELIDQQYLLENEKSYVLSQQGLLFADAISERLFRVS